MTIDLLKQLEVAADDTQRAAILQNATPEDLERLAGELCHREIWAEVAAATAIEQAFTAALEAAPDDAERLRLIEDARMEHGAAWLAEWAWWRTATAADASNRWINLVQGRTQV